MNTLNRFIFKLGMKEIDDYSCRQCGNPYLERDRVTLVRRMRRLISGYEVIRCHNCYTHWKIPRIWKKAS